MLLEVRASANPLDATLAEAFSQLLTRRIGVELKVELRAVGGTALLTQLESRQKPIRLIDERPKA